MLSVVAISVESWDAYDPWGTDQVSAMPSIPAHPNRPQSKNPPKNRRKCSSTVCTEILSGEYLDSDMRLVLQQIDSGHCFSSDEETLEPFPRGPPPNDEVAAVSGEGTFEFQCGYCQRVKTSNSEGSDGRTRIRCECGGKRKDGKPRMHANWVRIGTVERNKPDSKDAQIQALQARVEALEAENQALKERIQSS